MIATIVFAPVTHGLVKEELIRDWTLTRFSG